MILIVGRADNPIICASAKIRYDHMMSQLD
jgi:hypothetical protein